MSGASRIRPLIVLNWKMNPATLSEARRLMSGTRLAAKRVRRAEVVVCPPAPFVSRLARTGAAAGIGAQNCYYETKGSFTGEVSPSMLLDIGVTYVILGHSERRAMGESDDMISRKVSAALAEGLRPILCVGERERDEEGKYLEALSHELYASLSRVSRSDLARVVLAYEPIWAIGRGERDAMRPPEIAEMRIYLRKLLTDKFGAAAAVLVRILYGGSVGSGNTADILHVGEVDGLLVGHESRNLESLRGILEAASGPKRSGRDGHVRRTAESPRSRNIHASSRR